MHCCMHPARSVGVKAGALGFMLQMPGQAIWQALCCVRQALASGAAQTSPPLAGPGAAGAIGAVGAPSGGGFVVGSGWASADPARSPNNSVRMRNMAETLLGDAGRGVNHGGAAR